MNKYRPHIIVLPEDDANREMVNGFLLTPLLDARAIKVEEPSGGWGKVVKEFERNHIQDLENNQHRHLVLVIDFDKQADRLATVKRSIPAHLHDRVFVVGVWSEPEKLRSALSVDLERIGTMLADECVAGTSQTWGSELLAHNAEELARMTKTLKPILFS